MNFSLSKFAKILPNPAPIVRSHLQKNLPIYKCFWTAARFEFFFRKIRNASFRQRNRFFENKVYILKSREIYFLTEEI